MNIEVRYLSKSGNTQEIAEAIAKACKTEAMPITYEVPSGTDLLFIGGAVYAFDIGSELKEYISKLPLDIKLSAVFSTSAVVKSAYAQIKKSLEERGIPVSEKEFHCRGEFKFMHKGRPNHSDLEQAADFAKALIESSL